MTPSRHHIATLLMRIQNDFLDEPALALTLGEAGRRFGIDEVTCAALMATLTEAGVLARRPGGTYVKHYPQPAAA